MFNKDNIVTFLCFKKTLNMSSLIATKLKTNMGLVSIKMSLLSALSHMPMLKLLPRIQNNYNNKYSFDILICLQHFCKPHLFNILLTQLFAVLITIVL